MQLIAKAEMKKQQIVFAEVYAPNIPDSDGEFMDAEGIRKMAYQFMQKQRLDQIDSMHDNELVDGAHIVESFIARKSDDVFIEGAWVVGVHIPNSDDWAKVESGEWSGFSVEALVKKNPIEVEVSIPPVIIGKTLKWEEDDHDHKFYVSYSSDGKFLGGVTSESDGHIHKILRGTKTEIAKGHAHRFSHVENLTLKEIA